jgi:hypothetical protein
VTETSTPTPSAAGVTNEHLSSLRCAFGEKTYLVPGLGAKPLLAWQIFAVSLAA